MTPRELAAAIRGLFGEAETPIDRVTFNELVHRFPDRRKI